MSLSNTPYPLQPWKTLPGILEKLLTGTKRIYTNKQKYQDILFSAKYWFNPGRFPDLTKIVDWVVKDNLKQTKAKQGQNQGAAGSP